MISSSAPRYDCSIGWDNAHRGVDVRFLHVIIMNAVWGAEGVLALERIGRDLGLCIQTGAAAATDYNDDY